MDKIHLKLSAAGLAVGLAGSLLAGIGPAAAADDYPNRPIEIIVPFRAGGSIDVTFRTIQDLLSKELGQQVQVINKPGGGSTIGMNAVAKAKPDGYTLGAASFSFAANPVVMDNIPYNHLTDFEPITQISQSPLMLTTYPNAPANNVQEFIDWAKSKPGQLNFGSVGIGSYGHLVSELFCQRAGITMVHVPFTKGPLGALARGDIHLQITAIPSSIGWVKDGRLKALAVTSLKPFPTVPDLPPVAKTLPGFEAFEWPSLVAPKGTPRAIVDKIQKAVVKVIHTPQIEEQFTKLGTVPVGSTPEQLAAFIKEQTDLWAKIGQKLSKIKQVE